MFVDPACDWLTDSSDHLHEIGFQILEKSYVFSLVLDLSETFNDLCLANHHLQNFAALHLTPDPSGKIPSNFSVNKSAALLRRDIMENKGN